MAKNRAEPDGSPVPASSGPSSDLLSGFVLFGCAALAVIWANSVFGHSYHHVLEYPIQLPGFGVTFTLHHFINDALMVVFFLAVGLEIKLELLAGELGSVRKAALPIFAAIGGMVVPAALYVLFNPEGLAARGWAIPMATDIAFSLAILAMLSRRVPLSLKIFLTALAIVDDIGAVLVIAFFYSSKLNSLALLAAIAIMMLLTFLNRRGVRSLIPFLLIGVVLWYFVLISGIHATIAGILLAFTIPYRLPNKKKTAGPVKGGTPSPLEILAKSIHGFVLFIVMPVFALANSGVTITHDLASSLAHSVSSGIVVGLFIGKPLGIAGASYLAVRFGIASLPRGTNWIDLIGVGFIAGIGFTMSLFVAILAFQNTLPALELDQFAKIGIMIGSTLSALAGVGLLYLSSMRKIALEQTSKS